MSQNLSAVKAKVESLEESDMKRQKFERENQDLIEELEKLTVIGDQYESLQDEARSANDQVNNLTNRLAQNASRYTKHLNTTANLIRLISFGQKKCSISASICPISVTLSQFECIRLVTKHFNAHLIPLNKHLDNIQTSDCKNIRQTRLVVDRDKPAIRN